MTAVFIKIDTRNLVAYMSTDSSVKKAAESDKENSGAIDAAKDVMEYVIKDKLFNKVFAYILISFLVVNWRDILILFKSKEDILYTLSIVFVGGKLPFLDGVVLSPWVAHFFLPFVYGVIASIVSPIVTLAVSYVTTNIYYEMKFLDVNAYENKRKKQAKDVKERIDLEMNGRYSQKVLDERKKDLKDIDNEIKNKQDNFDKKRKEFIANINLTYDNILSLSELYKNGGFKIENQQDLYKFLSAIKESSFNNINFDKLFSEISRLHSEMQTDVSEK
ncbi:TPA: hypothetical protein ACWQ2P_003067 [Escherichia coli]